MLRRKSDERSAKRWNFDQRNQPDPEDYATTLMVAAVASAAASAATALIEIGRSAGWWH